MGIIGAILKDLLKKKKKEIQKKYAKKAAASEEREQKVDYTLGKKVLEAVVAIMEQLKKKDARATLGTSIYAYLFDPDDPKTFKIIRKILEISKERFPSPYPFGSHVLYQMMSQDPKVRTLIEKGISSPITMIFDFFAVTHGLEHPDEFVNNPEIIKKFLTFVKQLKTMGFANTPAGVFKKEELQDAKSLHRWGVGPRPSISKLPREELEEILEATARIVETYLSTLENKYGRSRPAEAAPPPEVTEELKQFLEERLKGLPEEEREKVRRAVEAWVLQVAGRTGRLETIKKNVEVLKKIVQRVTKTHSPAVAAALLKAAGEMGLGREELEALGRIVADPATRKMAEVLASKHSIKELALYLTGIMNREDLVRTWAEIFPKTKIPEDVLRRLSGERAKYAAATYRFQILGEALRAVEEAKTPEELRKALERYEYSLGKSARVLAQIADASEKLLKDRKFRKIAEEMEAELFDVTPGTVTKMLKLADALGEVLRKHHPVLKPVVGNKEIVRQILENAIREWWADNVSPEEAEYAGRYASLLASEIIKSMGTVHPKRIEDVQLEFLRQHFGRNAEFLSKLSRRFGELRLNVPETEELLPEKKVEVFETAFKTLREHYPRELMPAPKLEVKKRAH